MMPDEQQQQQPETQQQQQPETQQQPSQLVLSDEQLSKLSDAVGASAGEAAAGVLAAGSSDGSQGVTEVTLTDSQFTALTEQLSGWQETQTNSIRVVSTCSLFALLLSAAILGAVLVPLLLDRWRS